MELISRVIHWIGLLTEQVFNPIRMKKLRDGHLCPYITSLINWQSFRFPINPVASNEEQHDQQNILCTVSAPCTNRSTCHLYFSKSPDFYKRNGWRLVLLPYEKPSPPCPMSRKHSTRQLSQSLGQRVLCSRSTEITSIGLLIRTLLFLLQSFTVLRSENIFSSDTKDHPYVYLNETTFVWDLRLSSLLRFCHRRQIHVTMCSRDMWSRFLYSMYCYTT